MSRRQSLAATALIAFTLLTTACGGGGGGSAAPANTSVSSVVTLADLVLSAGAVSPAFQSTTVDYALSVPNMTNSTTVMAVTTDMNATVTVNGATVASGAASTPVALMVGDTTIGVIVTAEDGSTTQTYTVIVTRAPPGNIATLSGLTVSAGAISPMFQTTTSDYTLTVPNATSATTVTPTTTDSNATVTVNSVSVASGVASAPIALDTMTTQIAVEVTAEDGSTTQTYTVTVTRALATFEILDPSPGASDRFGTQVVILTNGNIVVTDPFDSIRFANNGAVHLYNPLTQTHIVSLYGDQGNDSLGSGGVTALGNGNFVIASPDDDAAGIVNAGSVRLIDGITGAQIGATLVGDQVVDQLGSDGVTALDNNNYVVVSSFDDDGSGLIPDAGSVRLFSGTTGDQIGTTMFGEQPSDRLGVSGITALGNNNYVIASGLDDVGAIVNAGSVRLVNGATGATIGAPVVGNQAEDRLGIFSAVALGNSNFVVASNDNIGATTDAGSVRLIDGTTGVQIGTAIVGDQVDDNLASGSVTALGNNNYVIASVFDDNGATVNAGSVRLVDGTTGAQLGPTLVGDQDNDSLGSDSIIALNNNNYVIVSRVDDDGLITDAGSVRLVDGASGVQIGVPIVGDQAGDFLGLSSVTALGNGNYVIATSSDDDGLIVDAGSVRLVDGSSGVPIGPVLVGNQVDDFLGSGSVTALANGNYVVASPFDDDGATADAGSVRLIDGTSGLSIGTPLVGDQADDQLGFNQVAALNNSNYAVTSQFDDDGTNADAGSVFLLNGASGAPIGTTVRGLSAFDFMRSRIVVPDSGSHFVFQAPFFDNTAGVNSGFVGLVAE